MPWNQPLPQSRRSFIYKSFGSPQSTLEILNHQLPPRDPTSLRVGVSYVPVNPSDLIPITGAYGQRISLPTVAGYEGVGCVLEAPQELSHIVGRRVLPLRGEGTWQTLVDCPVEHAIEVPDTVPDLVAARAYINPLAAILMLKKWPVRDKTVLLSGAGSSCAEYLGRSAISQGAKRVFGIYRSGCRRERLTSVGIIPVSMHDTDAVLRASSLTDVTFDSLGGEIARSVLERMGMSTDFVAYGLLTGKPVSVDAGTKATYHRFHLRDHLAALDGQGMRAAFSEIWPMLKKFPPSSPKVFLAQDWQEALTEAKRPGGQKPILDMSDLA